jgi:hypothetical protein
MRLKEDKIGRLMVRLNWTPRVFAEVIKADIREAYKLLSGEAVGYRTAKAFIAYFKASSAAAFIDFDAMGMKPPKFVRRQIAVSETVLFDNIAKNIRNLKK